MADKPGDEKKIPEDYGSLFNRINNEELEARRANLDIALQKACRENVYRGPHKTGRTRFEEIGNDMSAGGGKRLNSGKNRMELVPPEWDVALGDVSTQGSKKYDARNWEKGMEWSVMVGCMKRHLAKFEAGERYDGPEFNIEAGTTGCHHLAMVAWNALALMTYDLREIGKNDLPLGVTTKLLKRVNAITSDLGINQHEPD